MHVDAVGAAVDLRGADLHEFHQARLEAGGERGRPAGPGLHDVGGGGEEINLGSHWTIPFVGSDGHDEPGALDCDIAPKKICVAQIYAGRYGMCVPQFCQFRFDLPSVAMLICGAAASVPAKVNIQPRSMTRFNPRMSAIKALASSTRFVAMFATIRFTAMRPPTLRSGKTRT